MSDDSPWMPPPPGEPERAVLDADDAVGDVAPSPWARPVGNGSSDAPVHVPPADEAAAWAFPGDAATEPGESAGPGTSSSGEPSGPVDRAGPVWTGSVASGPPITVDAHPARRRSPLLVLTATAAVVAIGLAGIFAVRRITGTTSSGGATPEELGERLLSAIEGEDVLGMIDTLLPGERRSLGQPFVDAMGELQRLEVLSSDLDLSGLLGIDVELSNESVSATSTNVDDIAHLQLGADVVATLDGATLPIGDLVTDRMPADMLTELRGTRTTETDRFDIELTAVESEGRWYVSLLHTAAEAARVGVGADPIPVVGVLAVGGESPDDAVDRFFSAVSGLDVRGMIQLLDPDEAMALQRYAPLFLPEAEAALAEFPGVVRVTDHEVRLEGSGGRRTAFVETFAAELSHDDGTASMEYADGCWRVEETFTGESMEMCDATGWGATTAGLDLPPEIEVLGEVVADALADMAAVGVELRERDGAWYLSPMATVTEAMLAVMRALDRTELDRIIDAVPPALESLLPWIFGGFDDVLGAELSGGVIDDLGLPGRDGSLGDANLLDDEISAGDRCFGATDVVEAQACFEEALARGEVEPWEVPVQMRHPECGLAELSWSVEIYEMSDEEFTSTVAASVPCFESLVADGQLEQWEVPFEVANLDCFEGRNWYAVFDGDYNDRVFACIDAGGG